METVAERMKRLGVCALIPTYNNAGTIGDVLFKLLEITDDVIIVNDGSTDQTPKILEKFPSIKVFTHEVNQGKGMALRNGFKEAVSSGYHHAITLDSDGQHDPQDIPKFLDTLEKMGRCLIIGARNMDQDSVPKKSSFGNRFSNFWFWVETGIKAPDTQSGYRLYPVKALDGMRFFTKKFEFEIEVIVRASWKGLPVLFVPVSVYYAPADERVSHFRPFRDFTRISILNTVLFILTMLYFLPRRVLMSLFNKRTYQNLWKELTLKNEPKWKTVSSVALGVSMGIFPIWGFQLVTAISLAILFRLNKPLVILSANVSLPPFIPLIIYGSLYMGSFWTGHSIDSLHFHPDMTWKEVHSHGIQYILGSITLAIVGAAVAGFITWLILMMRDLFMKREIHA